MLFRNATLITMDGGSGLEKHDRFLMPGLAEMHAHVPGPEPAGYAEDLLTHFVAHGITTIRGTLGQPLHLELRARIERGELIGPRLSTSGPSINGNTAPDAATAERMVRELETAGYDFLKLHSGLQRDVFDTLVATARAEAIPFSGHVSTEVGVTHALAANQSAIDHLDGYIMALAAERCLDDAKRAGLMGLGFADCADESRIPALVTATNAARTDRIPMPASARQVDDDFRSADRLISRAA